MNNIFTKKILKYIGRMGIICGIIVLVYSSPARAQNWTALPPYNTLWPLWSPTLSPIDPATGVTTPIVNSLTPDTVLPVQPGLTWDPALGYPWLLYNTPLGMAYYEPSAGIIDMWPPTQLLDSLGDPLPLSLPLNYAALPPTSTWLAPYIALLNDAYQFSLYDLFSLYPSPPTPLTISFSPPDVIGIGLPFLPTATTGKPSLTPLPVVVPPVLSPTAVFGYTPAIDPYAIFSWLSPLPLPPVP